MIVLKELDANINALCISYTLESTSSASRVVSAVAELLVDITTQTDSRETE